MKKPVTVTITGAAGNIGYALAFRVASGQMLGADQGHQSARARLGAQCPQAREHALLEVFVVVIVPASI